MRTANEILDEIRLLKGLDSDTALGKLFGVKQSTVASWRSRNSVPFADVIAFCDKEGLSTDAVFIECKHTIPPRAVSEEPSIFLSFCSHSKNDIKMINQLKRILEEHNQKKIRAIESQLDLLDPGEQYSSVIHEDDPVGYSSSRQHRVRKTAADLSAKKAAAVDAAYFAAQTLNMSDEEKKELREVIEERIRKESVGDSVGETDELRSTGT